MAKIVYGAVTLGWMLIMALFSSQPYERQDIRPWLERALSRTGLERIADGIAFRYGHTVVSVRELGLGGFAEFMVRKLAHLTEYAVLGCLLLFLLSAMFRRGRWLVPAVVALIFVFATMDEFHQSFVQGRTALPEDVLLDTLGACIGVLLALPALHSTKEAPPLAGGGRKERAG